MKIFHCALAASAVLFSPAFCNFDIYMVDETTRIGGATYEGMAWQVFDGVPSSCDQVINQRAWLASDDVSGTKQGVRCVGSGCDYHPSADNIDVLEMNFHGDGNVLHWTLYKNGGRQMVGLDGNTYGNCVVYPGGDYECTDGMITWRHGYRKFRCTTRFTAEDLNNS